MYYFIQERSEAGDIIVDYISTLQQQADILTKPLDVSHYIYMRELLGIKPSPLFATNLSS